MLAVPASKSAGDLVEPTTPRMGALCQARRCLIRIRLNRGCPQSSFYRWKRRLAVCELNCHQMLAQFAKELAVLKQLHAKQQRKNVERQGAIDSTTKDLEQFHEKHQQSLHSSQKHRRSPSFGVADCDEDGRSSSDVRHPVQEPAEASPHVSCSDPAISGPNV